MSPGLFYVCPIRTTPKKPALSGTRMTHAGHIHAALHRNSMTRCIRHQGAIDTVQAELSGRLPKQANHLLRVPVRNGPPGSPDSLAEGVNI